MRFSSWWGILRKLEYQSKRQAGYAEWTTDFFSVCIANVHHHFRLLKWNRQKSAVCKKKKNPLLSKKEKKANHFRTLNLSIAEINIFSHFNVFQEFIIGYMLHKLQRECDFLLNSLNNKLKLKWTVSIPKKYICNILWLAMSSGERKRN